METSKETLTPEVILNSGDTGVETSEKTGISGFMERVKKAVALLININEKPKQRVSKSITDVSRDGLGGISFNHYDLIEA